MSRKSDILKKIKESEQEIENLEKRRGRSQSALLEAVVIGEKPNETYRFGKTEFKETQSRT